MSSTAPHRPPCCQPPRVPCSALLRGAGLRVTSARLAVMRLAPDVYRAHGRLSARAMHEAAGRHGYAISLSACYHALSALARARLLPCDPPPRPVADAFVPVPCPLDDHADATPSS